MTFYHAAPRPLGIDTTLTVGIYAERVRDEEFVRRHYARYLLEEIFEDIRQRHYAQAPSRFNCVFLFPDLSIAREFYANACGYKNYVYAVEVVDGEPFVAEMDLLRCEGQRYEVICQNAHKYWQQKQHPNSGTLEVLLSGKALVRQLVLEPSKIW